MDTNWLYYNNVISPIVFLSFAATLLCSYVLSPTILNVIAPNQKFGRKAMYVHTYITSTIHAVVTCMAALIALAQGDLGKDRTFGVNSAGVTALHVTVGYTLGDTLIILMDPYLRSIYSSLLHHVAMIAGLLLCLYYELFLFFVICRVLSEFSTPFVNLRGVLSEIGNKKGQLYVAASILMMVTFFLCRVVVIPLHTYALFAVLVSTEASTVSMSLKMTMVLNTVTFDILNMFWFYKILRGGYKFFFHGKPSTE